MRKRLVAGNWKMNTDFNDGVALLKDILAQTTTEDLNAADMHVYAPFTHLSEFSRMTQDSGITIGGQNCHQEVSGAYTGEVSASMLASLPVRSVILGHSERRQYFGESNSLLKAKIRTALDAGLNVIYCYGETLEEREANRHFEVVETQLREGVSGFTTEDWDKITLAYEPVWAIGTGMTASAEQAQEIHAHSRGVVSDLAGAETASQTRILYGGSVKPANAGELFAMHDIDGGLIGGAALKADSFLGIVRA